MSSEQWYSHAEGDHGEVLLMKSGHRCLVVSLGTSSGIPGQSICYVGNKSLRTTRTQIHKIWPESTKTTSDRHEANNVLTV